VCHEASNHDNAEQLEPGAAVLAAAYDGNAIVFPAE